MVGESPQSTTARLVDRFRRAPPRPRGERESNDEIWTENGYAQDKFWWRECKRGNRNINNGEEKKKAVLMRINKENTAVIDQSKAELKERNEKNEQMFKTLRVRGTSRGEIKTEDEEEKNKSKKKVSLKSGEEYPSRGPVGDEEKEGALQRMNTVEDRMIAVRASPPLSTIATHLSVFDTTPPPHPRYDNSEHSSTTSSSPPLVRGATAQGYSDVAGYNNKIRLHVDDADNEEQYAALAAMDQRVEDMIEGIKRCELEVEKEENPSDIIERLRIQLGLDRTLLPISCNTGDCLKRPPSPLFHVDSSRPLMMTEDLIQDSLHKLGGRTEHVLEVSGRSSCSGYLALPPTRTTFFKSEDGESSHHSHAEWGECLEDDAETQLLNCHDFDSDPVVATLRQRMDQLQKQLKLKQCPES